MNTKNRKKIVDTFLPPVDGDGLSVLPPPHDLGRGEAVRLAHQADVLVLTHRHRRLRTLLIQDIRWH